MKTVTDVAQELIEAENGRQAAPIVETGRRFGDSEIFKATEQLRQRIADHAEHLERVVCDAIQQALPMGSTGMDANLREAVRTAVGRTSMLDQRVAMAMDRLDAMANRFQVMINKLDEEGGFAKARLAGKRGAITKARKRGK